MHLNPATPSGRKTADAAIFAGPARLVGAWLEGDGTNAATVILYDNASAASGTVLWKGLLPANGIMYIDANLPLGGIVANSGIYADVTGTGAAYEVYFAPVG